jgi:multidrug resistance protein, MATE family
VLTAALVPILTVWFNAEAILLILKQEPEVARLAGLYLRWLSLGLPAYAFNAVARRYFQSQGKGAVLVSSSKLSVNPGVSSGFFTVPTNIILVIAPINALLNYLLGKLLCGAMTYVAQYLIVWGPESIRLGFIG